MTDLEVNLNTVVSRDNIKVVRQHLRQIRRALTEDQQQKASREIVQHVAQHSRFREAEHIASYWPQQGEVDPRGISPGSTQTIYLPVITGSDNPDAERGLLFATGDEFRPNRYGIPEPTGPRLSISSLDYLLVPLVAFDDLGNRIGMGGGYYDRVLSARDAARNTFTLGVAYSFQEVGRIHPQPWDVALDGVVTEGGIRIFGES